VGEPARRWWVRDLGVQHVQVDVYLFFLVFFFLFSLPFPLPSLLTAQLAVSVPSEAGYPSPRNLSFPASESQKGNTSEEEMSTASTTIEDGLAASPGWLKRVGCRLSDGGAKRGRTPNRTVSPPATLNTRDVSPNSPSRSYGALDTTVCPLQLLSFGLCCHDPQAMTAKHTRLSPTTIVRAKCDPENKVLESNSLPCFVLPARPGFESVQSWAIFGFDPVMLPWSSE